MRGQSVGCAWRGRGRVTHGRDVRLRHRVARLVGGELHDAVQDVAAVDAELRAVDVVLRLPLEVLVVREPPVACSTTAARGTRRVNARGRGREEVQVKGRGREGNGPTQGLTVWILQEGGRGRGEKGRRRVNERMQAPIARAATAHLQIEVVGGLDANPRRVKGAAAVGGRAANDPLQAQGSHRPASPARGAAKRLRTAAPVAHSPWPPRGSGCPWRWGWCRRHTPSSPGRGPARDQREKRRGNGARDEREAVAKLHPPVEHFPARTHLRNGRGAQRREADSQKLHSW